MPLFTKAPLTAITSKIIFHASTLGLPERQQLGKATLSPEGFRLDIPATKDTKAIQLQVPLTKISNLRAFQKKTYSSIFYVIQVDYLNDNNEPCMVSCEIRVFLRRGQALVAVKEWKEVYKRLLAQA
ncbi:MAG: hypothetical protein KKD73_02910 [Proteobacteria bacterium]|nr:hypothetical protein [Pseudomonadota bacterium]MBU1640403.1 hypothetical protein [Pseudomonadota bacterium]